MKKRMGRPPKPKTQKKSKLVQLRVSSAEHRTLKEKADAAGLSVSEFLRQQAKGLKMLMQDWSEAKLEARIEKTRSLIAALDAMEKEPRALLRKFRAAQETHLKNMEHVLKGKKA